MLLWHKVVEWSGVPSVTFQLMLIIHVMLAQVEVKIEVPAEIVLFTDPQSLTELLSNNSQAGTPLRLSLVCAAYGEPYYPYIRWSSPLEGIEDYNSTAINDSSVIVTTDYLQSAAITVSVLQLCDIYANNLTVYECSADNGVDRNATTSNFVSGRSSVMYVFNNDSVRAILAVGEPFDIPFPTMKFIPPTVLLPTEEIPTEGGVSTTSSPSNPQSPSNNSLSAAVKAIIATLVVCTVAISLTILASRIIVVWNNKKNKEATGNIIRLDLAAPTDSDTLYDCNAYHQTFRDVQQSLHIYSYIDDLDLPIRPTDETTQPQSFAVYQCPAYGTHKAETPLDDSLVTDRKSGDSIPDNCGNPAPEDGEVFASTDVDSLPIEANVPPSDREDKEIDEGYDRLHSLPELSDSLPNEIYQTIDLSAVQLHTQ